MNYLIGKGHKRIAFLGGALVTGDVYSDKRCKGYLDALRSAGIKEDISLIKDCEWDFEMCHAKTLELIDSPDRPTAIFTVSDINGIIALNAIHERGLRVPEDIAVVGLNNIEMSKYTNPPLTTLSVPLTEIGRVAADTLLARIKGDTSLPKKIILPTELIVRSST
jgi:LacI family transcriptional regulator